MTLLRALGLAVVVVGRCGADGTKFASRPELGAAVAEWIHDPAAARAAHGGDIGEWDVSRVTNMTGLFLRRTTFNEDLGRWDVSRVTDMRAMFLGASAFAQDLGWCDVPSTRARFAAGSGCEATACGVTFSRRGRARKKVGFMFLVTRAPAYDWETFLWPALVSNTAVVAVHAPPDLKLPPFWDARRVRRPVVPTKWGDMSLVNATYALMAHVLGDHAVQRVVLLSETCVPLRGVDALFRSLFERKTSFTAHGAYGIAHGCPKSVAARLENVGPFPSGGDPEKQSHECVKHQQFFSMTRDHAALLLHHRASAMRTLAPMQWADEGVFGTTLALLGRLPEVTFDAWTDYGKYVIYERSVNCERRTKWKAHPESISADDLAWFANHTSCLFVRKVYREADMLPPPPSRCLARAASVGLADATPCREHGWFPCEAEVKAAR